MTTPKIPTKIVDKNGKQTTVHKNAEQPGKNARQLPAVGGAQKPVRVSENPFITPEAGEKITALLIEKLGHSDHPMSTEQLLEGHLLKHNNGGEYWWSGKSGEFKLYGDSSPFHAPYVHTRNADRASRLKVDEVNAELAEITGRKAAAPLAKPRIPARWDGGEIVFSDGDKEIRIEDLPSFREPDNFMPVIIEKEGDNYRTAWASHDDDPIQFEFAEDDSFTVFRSEAERDSFIEQQVADGVPRDNIFIIDKFDHSSVHYSVQDTAAYPDRRWDVAPSGVFVSKETDERYKPTVDSVNDIMNDYSNWSNGDTYGIITGLYSAEGEELEAEEIWGFVGSDYTKETLEMGVY